MTEPTIETTISQPSVRLVRGSTTSDMPVLEIFAPEGVFTRIYDARSGNDDYRIDIFDPTKLQFHHIQIPSMRYSYPSNQPWAMTADLPPSMGQAAMRQLVVNHMDPRRNSLTEYDTAGNDLANLRNAVKSVQREWRTFDGNRRASPTHPPVFDFDTLTEGLQRVIDAPSLVKFDTVNRNGVRPQST